MTNPTPLTYTYPQAAELIGVSRSTIGRMVRAGELVTVIIRGRRRILANGPLLLKLVGQQ